MSQAFSCWDYFPLFVLSSYESTFLVGKRPVNVCKKLDVSVCEDIRLQLRSTAYGVEMNEWWENINIAGMTAKPKHCIVLEQAGTVAQRPSLLLHVSLCNLKLPEQQHSRNTKTASTDLVCKMHVLMIVIFRVLQRMKLLYGL